ncbi:Diphthine synthase [Echinococcus granulosus]|uniref:diphthine methyl ester synthase n=1 Tax=Echinococcus granulosus TaxID=6210 RepID=W6UNI0_ECHGR|nr:Diphthine synthase [Echinococcus granulosus]EUB62758.1 Diphthine synthase [Echinococcus granulosus]
MLYVIGLGLSTIEDISIAGLNAIQECDYVFLDAYTSILTHGIEKVSAFCGKEVRKADREFTEQDSLMISLAKGENVAFLVIKEKSLDNLLHDRDIYEPPRFMLCSEAAYQILEAGCRIRQRFMDASADPDVEAPCEPEPEIYLHPDCLAICLARVGSPTQAMLVTTMGILSTTLLTGDTDNHPNILSGPLHSLIIPGKLHPMEIEFLAARLLIGDGKEDLENVPNGTSLPVLLPPTKASRSFRERVEAMFDRHHELLSTNF